MKTKIKIIINSYFYFGTFLSKFCLKNLENLKIKLVWLYALYVHVYVIIEMPQKKKLTFHIQDHVKLIFSFLNVTPKNIMFMIKCTIRTCLPYIWSLIFLFFLLLRLAPKNKRNLPYYNQNTMT